MWGVEGGWILFQTNRICETGNVRNHETEWFISGPQDVDVERERETEGREGV
jgi:hypothetical protein